MLFIYLSKRTGWHAAWELLITPGKIIVASCITGIALYIPLKLFDQLIFDTTRTFGLLLLTGVAGGAGLVTYLLLAWVFDVSEVKSFVELIRRVRKPKAVLLAPVNEVIGNGMQDKLT